MGLLGNIIPLVVLFVVVGVFAAVGFVVYSIVQDISSKTKQKMEKKNVIVTRDGLKVGVKELKDEEYKDRSQSVLVKVWDASKGGNGSADSSSSSASGEKRQSLFRSSSSRNKVK